MGTPASLSSPCSLIFVVAVALLSHCCSIAMASSSFTISNYCSEPIWPATLAGAGTPQLSTTGFRLDPGQTVQVPAPTGWSGRMWARTGCAFDAAGGNGTCATGDCGGGRLECAGTGALPPATLFEVTLGKNAGDLDYYDVSLVDSYNLPVVAVPRGGAAGCNATGCMADLNRSSPRELQVNRGGDTVACRSACEAFGQDQYCCSGAYATPTTCRPTAYSSVFKSACPRAYSYAYDDRSSTFTCGNAAGYTIAFCLPPSGWQNSGAVPIGVGSPPAYGQSTSGSTSGSASDTPPPATDNNGGIGSTNPPPPTTNNNGGIGTTNPPSRATDNNGGIGSTSTPPPATDTNGFGSAYPPRSTTDNNGGGSTYQPPAASTDNNGFGSTYQPPPAASYGAGGTYDQPPWMTLSSASKLHEQLWLVLPAVLLFLLWAFSP